MMMPGIWGGGVGSCSALNICLWVGIRCSRPGSPESHGRPNRLSPVEIYHLDSLIELVQYYPAVSEFSHSLMHNWLCSVSSIYDLFDSYYCAFFLK
ncbi:hypothetical protein BDW67DRAFT_154703 [Aspergillus spinulosporus]